MRILFVTHYFPPESFAGVEVYTYNLAQYLRAEGHEVFVVHSGEDPSLEHAQITLKAYDRIPCFVINTLSQPSTFEQTYTDTRIDEQFERILQIVKPDIAHINHLKRLSFGMVATAKAQHIPVVLTLHDYWLICPQVHLHKNFDVCLRKTNPDCARCIERQGFGYDEQLIAARDQYFEHLAANVTQFVSPSQFLIRQFRDRVSSFAAMDTLYLPNGVTNTTTHRHPPRSPRVRFTIAYAGAIHFAKGLHVLLRAFDLLEKDRFTLFLLGAVQSQYERELDREFPDWKSYYHGAYQPADIVEILSENADVLVFPSVIYENYPTVINEALLAGVPIIASHLGGTTEQIREQVNGFLFDPFDVDNLVEKIRYIAAHPEVYHSLKQHIEHQTIPLFSDHIHAVKGIYDTLVGATQRQEQPVNLLELFTLSYAEQHMRSNKYARTCLFLDTGEGFAETPDIVTPVGLFSRTFAVTYDLTPYGAIRRVKWVPMRESACRLRLDRVCYADDAGAHDIDAASIETNGMRRADGWISFLTLQPMCCFELSRNVRSLKITGEWKRIANDKFMRKIDEQICQHQQKNGLRNRLSRAACGLKNFMRRFFR